MIVVNPRRRCRYYCYMDMIGTNLYTNICIILQYIIVIFWLVVWDLFDLTPRKWNRGNTTRVNYSDGSVARFDSCPCHENFISSHMNTFNFKLSPLLLRQCHEKIVWRYTHIWSSQPWRYLLLTKWIKSSRFNL